MKNYFLIFLSGCLFFVSCSSSRRTAVVNKSSGNEIAPQAPVRSSVVIKKKEPDVEINTGRVRAQQIIDFAMKQLGVPYRYGSTDKSKGFDCSGFITYVFSHFNISVPRITFQFTNAGVNIPIEFSKPGDIILFTDSDKNSGVVGHMGIITENDGGSVKFIHASSSRGVMISGMNSYFIPRFVKVNRIFIP